jgi:hypothetical protein
MLLIHLILGAHFKSTFGAYTIERQMLPYFIINIHSSQNSNKAIAKRIE